MSAIRAGTYASVKRWMSNGEGYRERDPRERT
jgi:hypothetical protein